MITQQVMEILGCPACKSRLAQTQDRLTCENGQCGLRFPIRDEIPVMLIDEAERPTGRGRC